jgi:quercetin dioxygenase-like cupin family protein
MTKRALWAAAGAWLVAGAAIASEAAPAITRGSQKTLFENERVRTYEVTLQKGGTIAMHTHAGEHQVYTIAGGTLRGTDAEGKTTDMTLEAGRTVFVPALSHSLENVGKSTIRAIVTELKEAAPSGALSNGEREELLGLFSKGQRELLDLVASTPEELWAKKPAPDRWSVSEIVEHLGAAEPMLFGMAQQALATPADANWASVAGRISTDAFLGMIQNRGQKFQAPEPIQPKGGMSRADALAKFGAARAVTAEFVRRTDLPIKKHVAQGPAGPMNVHQMMVLIGAHVLRHNAQIREALDQLKAK